MSVVTFGGIDDWSQTRNGAVYNQNMPSLHVPSFMNPATQLANDGRTAIPAPQPYASPMRYGPTHLEPAPAYNGLDST